MDWPTQLFNPKFWWPTGLFFMIDGAYWYGAYWYHPEYKNNTRCRAKGKFLFLGGLSILIAAFSPKAALIFIFFCVMGLHAAYMARLTREGRRPFSFLMPSLLHRRSGAASGEAERSGVRDSRTVFTQGPTFEHFKARQTKLRRLGIVFGAVPGAALLALLKPFSSSRGSLGAWRVLIALPLLLMLRLGPKLWQKADYFGFLAQSLHEGMVQRQALERYIEAKLPFALYLRDFSGESDPNESFTIWTSLRGVPWPIPPSHYRERLENNLLGSIASGLTVFSFLNAYDFIRDPTAKRVNVSGLDWRTIFSRCASQTVLIVIAVEYFGAGMDFELTWLAENAITGKLLLAATEDSFEALAKSYPNFLDHVTWRIKLSGFECDPIPDDLKEYLSRFEGHKADSGAAP